MILTALIQVKAVERKKAAAAQREANRHEWRGHNNNNNSNNHHDNSSNNKNKHKIYTTMLWPNAEKCRSASKITSVPKSTFHKSFMRSAGESEDEKKNKFTARNA